MRDPFASPKRRIARAKKHIDDFDARMKAFFETDPYAHVTEADPNGAENLHKVKLTKPIPGELGDIAAETIEGLRSSLDQAVYATAVANGRANPTSAYFPIADSVDDLANVIKGRCKHVPPDIITLLRAFNPHKGGNDVIWALNKLCNINKHRLLVGFATTSNAVHIAYAQGPISIFAPQWDSRKNEIIFARTPRDAQPNYNINVETNITFGEVDILRGAPAGAVIREMASEIESVVLAIEAETRRLGLIV